MKLCSIPPLNSPLVLPSSVAVIPSPSAIAIVIGVHNFSNLDFFSKLFDVMGIEMTECLVLYLKQRDGKKKGGGNINESLM